MYLQSLQTLQSFFLKSFCRCPFYAVHSSFWNNVIRSKKPKTIWQDSVGIRFYNQDILPAASDRERFQIKEFDIFHKSEVDTIQSMSPIFSRNLKSMRNCNKSHEEIKKYLCSGLKCKRAGFFFSLNSN